MNSISLFSRSRIYGLHFGYATVDALGGPLEFGPRTPESVAPISEYIPNSNFGIGPGHFTDDTSMLLCLSTSLSSVKSSVAGIGGFDIKDQTERYCRWYRQGYMSSTGQCFDIGNSTRTALDIFNSNSTSHHYWLNEEEFAKGFKEVKALLDGKNFCGNGSLMRVAPVAAAFINLSDSPQDRERLFSFARKSSLPTHPYILNQDSCALYVGAVWDALKGKSKAQILDGITSFVASSEQVQSQLAHITSKEFIFYHRDKISSSGFVVNTLTAVLWCFFTTENFKDGAVKAVNLGNDADTVGAIYGALAGSFYGLQSIPENWRDELVEKELVEAAAESMCSRVMI